MLTREYDREIYTAYNVQAIKSHRMYRRFGAIEPSGKKLVWNEQMAERNRITSVYNPTLFVAAAALFWCWADTLFAVTRFTSEAIIRKSFFSRYVFAHFVLHVYFVYADPILLANLILPFTHTLFPLTLWLQLFSPE